MQLIIYLSSNSGCSCTQLSNLEERGQPVPSHPDNNSTMSVRKNGEQQQKRQNNRVPFNIKWSPQEQNRFVLAGRKKISLYEVSDSQ